MIKGRGDGSVSEGLLCRDKEMFNVSLTTHIDISLSFRACVPNTGSRDRQVVG